MSIENTEDRYIDVFLILILILSVAMFIQRFL